MLKAGDAAPAFTLPDQAGAPVSLRRVLDGSAVVLFFYPGDFTPVCTREVCMVRDLYTELSAAGLAVIGVSPDSIESHERFRRRHALPFTLLADPDKRVVRAYGVDGPLGIGVRRATFLIDPNAVIRDVVSAALRVSRHESFLRRALRVQISLGR
jgi:peroxiredoxin Q/BCP